MKQSNKPTILIIDDEAAFRTIYRDMFEHEGFEVLEADNGERGWEIAKEKHPDLVLLDLVMPHMHGLEVLKRIRGYKTTESMQVIIFTALDEMENVASGLLSGADEYLAKGVYSPKELSHIITSLLEKKPRRGKKIHQRHARDN